MVIGSDYTTVTASAMKGNYDRYEATMIAMAGEEGWEFFDGQEQVAPELVFNQATYGAAVLKIAELDIADRGIDAQLGLSFIPNEESLMGMSVEFDDEPQKQASIKAMIWRLALSTHVIRSLPRLGRGYDLSVLYAAFNQTPRLENV